jgi:hypothetical protein
VHKLLKSLVGARGFEPRTSCAQGRRATRLRYAPTANALLIIRRLPSCMLPQEANLAFTE